MKIVTKTKYLLVGLVLLGSAAASVAVTLGRARGAVLVGQALNVSVLVQGDPGDGSSLPCLEADVVLGDNRLMPGEVRVQSEPAAQADAINVRISTLRAVDEASIAHLPGIEKIVEPEDTNGNGHGGNGNRNCTLTEDASLATPAYPYVAGQGPDTTWASSIESDKQ